MLVLFYRLASRASHRRRRARSRPPEAVSDLRSSKQGTGRGVPLVELKTVNQIRYYTDSNGIVAFDEPGMFNQQGLFLDPQPRLRSRKRWTWAIAAQAFLITEGGSAQVVIRRLNIARRLYRVTGEGIYRDSVLTGVAAPIREPLLERTGLRPGQRRERGLSGENPLVLGRHESSRLSAGQFPRAGGDLGAAGPRAVSSPRRAST